MTRETKVGLVVAGSFLCLVGVVVAARWKRNAEANPVAPVTQAAVVPNAFAEAGKKDQKNAFPEKNSPPAILPTGLQEAPAAPVLPKPSEEKSFPFAPDAPKTSLPVAPPLTPPPLTPPPVLAPGVTPETKLLEAPKVAAETFLDDVQKKTLDALKKSKEAAAGVAAVALPGTTVEAHQFVPVPKALDGFPAVPVAPVPVAQDKKEPFASLALDKKNDIPPPAPVNEKPAPPADPFTTLKKDTPAPPPVEPFASTAPVKPTTVPKNDLPPPAPPTVDPGPFAKPFTSAEPAAPKQNSPFPAQPPAPQPAPLAETKPIDPLPAPASPPASTAPITFNKEPTNPTLPPLGAENKSPFGPVTVPPVNIKSTNLPQVTSFTPENYTCQADDRSFETISTRKFGSPKYGRALLQYNRDHPSAAPSLRQENPSLQPGQVVYLPPTEFLESRYAAMIDNRATFTAAPAISISPPLNSNPNPAPGNAALAAPGVGRIPNPIVPTRDATKAYRVPGQGQMLIEIAQQTLGNRGRWSEIYRLNPTLRPEYPIPGGTEIRLPVNANVP